MRGLVFPGNESVELRTFPDPTPGELDVVIEIKASGLCGTDLQFYRGQSVSKRPILVEGLAIGGHEPCGVISAVGKAVPPSVAKVGDRVMVHHYAGCCACTHCRTGWQQLCKSTMVKVYGVNCHGAHADYLLVPANTVVHLPDELSFAAGAAISCGTGTAYGALRRLGLTGPDTIAVFGQGAVGLSATQLAKAMGARVIAIDFNEKRLALAQSVGADFVINPAGTDLQEAIASLTHGQGVDATLDTSGSPQARADAVRALKTWGKACFVGEGGELNLNVSPDLIRKQITVMGSWTFSTSQQIDLANFIVERKIDVDAIITDKWALEDAQEAYAIFNQQSTGKSVFVFD